MDDKEQEKQALFTAVAVAATATVSALATLVGVVMVVRELYLLIGG